MDYRDPNWPALVGELASGGAGASIDHTGSPLVRAVTARRHGGAYGMEWSALQASLDKLREVPSDWISLPNLGEMEFGYPDSDIDSVIDVGEYLCAKIAALAAHATQVALAPDRRSVLVSNNFVQPILTKEHYILAGGARAT